MTFPEGSLVHLPIYALLALADVDLDSRQTEAKFKGENSNGQEVLPFVRTTGIIFIMHLNYHSQISWFRVREVEATISVEAVYEWASMGNDPNYIVYSIDGEGIQTLINPYNYGIDIQFEISGTIHRFDVFALVRTLTEGAVLLSLAQQTIGLLAMYGVAGRSERRLISQAVMHEFKPRKVMARFALQSIRYLQQFKECDTDEDGFITRRELHRQVIQAFGEVFSEDDGKILSEMIMMEADSCISAMRKIGDGRLTADEWCQIQTIDGGMDLQALVQEITNSMPQAKRKEYLDRFDGKGRHSEWIQKRSLSLYSTGDEINIKKEDDFLRNTVDKSKSNSTNAECSDRSATPPPPHSDGDSVLPNHPKFEP
ncbi:hypothetical protein CYMTET_34547 [Cymbomonas tetramitiformis]|uniref:EF-hand domain-containing protein n=1 Tax=Cymbomonas tetramitiformis TaxID=36881 RepID=A0AAE0KQ30_9CHLO|nr:hypothetical protein CYMTET_34547 [Cymbomonas tetramitiformis]